MITEDLMDERKKIFISFSSKDIPIARLVYHHLLSQDWSTVDIFFSDKSIRPTEDSNTECIENCGNANLGIIILTENSIKSSFVNQEMGICLSKGIKRYFVEMSKGLYHEIGFDKNTQVFKFHQEERPLNGLEKIARDVERLLSIAPPLGKKEEKRKFEKGYLNGSCVYPSNRRDACILLKSLKCAEREIKIMGENSLQPIHGGFEDLKDFLKTGGTVKVLINDYDSEEYACREKIEGAETTGRIRADWIATIANLKQLDQIKENDNLEVKITGKELIGSIVIIDDWVLQYNKYNRKKVQEGDREFASGVFVYLNRSEGQIDFQKYSSEFKNVWNNPNSEKLELCDIDPTKLIPKKFR